MMVIKEKRKDIFIIILFFSLFFSLVSIRSFGSWYNTRYLVRDLYRYRCTGTVDLLLVRRLTSIIKILLLYILLDINYYYLFLG